MVGIDIDSAVSPPAGFQLEVTVFHWVSKETAWALLTMDILTYLPWLYILRLHLVRLLLVWLLLLWPRLRVEGDGALAVEVVVAQDGGARACSGLGLGSGSELGLGLGLGLGLRPALG